jgi:hypothetical protein
MIRMIVRKLFFALGFFSLTASASPNWVRYQDYKINLEVPTGWKIERDLYGMPLTVLGPERGGERAIINIQHTPIENFEFDEKLIRATQAQYFIGRQQWLDQSEDTELLKKIPYQAFAPRKNVSGFQIGFQYRMRGEEFEERSIQVSCNGRLYFVKSLYSKKEPKADRETLAKIIQNLNCATVTDGDGAYHPSKLAGLAEKLEALSSENRWPTQQQVRSANVETKAVLLESTVEFYKNFETAAGEDLYSQSERSTSIKNLIDRLSNGLMHPAFAQGSYDCFFGGWPSQYVKKENRLTCASPSIANSDYATTATACETNQLACNPALFGKGICISITSAAERSNATQRCEIGFKRAGKSYDDVVKDPQFNQNLFEQTIESAESVCGSTDYASSNYGLCNVLKEKLNLSIHNGTKKNDSSDQSFVNHLDAIKPANYDKAVDATFDHYSEFEKRCFDDKKNFKPDSDSEMNPIERDQCIQDLQAMTDDLNRLEKMHQDVEKTAKKSTQETSTESAKRASTSVPNQSCVNCGQKGAAEAAAADEGGSCPTKSAAQKKAGECTAATYANAVANIALAIGPALWKNVTAVYDLAKDAVVYTKKKAKQAWNWMFSSAEVENQTANKAHQASKTSNGFLTQLMKDPKGTISNFASAILSGMKDFFANDIFCAKWEGLAHYSKCKIPGDRCASCDTIVRGIGSLTGYAIAELIPAFVTGGLVGSGPKIAEFMKLKRLSGGFAEVAEAATSKFPEWSRVVARGVSGTLKASVKVAQESKVVRYSEKALKTTVAALTRTKALRRLFKSKIYKDYPDMMANLNRLRSKYWVVKAGVWTAKKTAVTASNVITAVPRALYQTSKWIAQKGPIGLEKRMAVKGLKLGQRLADEGPITRAALSKARSLGLVASNAKYAANSIRTTSAVSQVQNRQSDYAETLKAIAPKLVRGESLTEKETEVFAKANGYSVEEAKLNLTDEKLTLLYANDVKPKFSDDELNRYYKDRAKSSGQDPNYYAAEWKLKLLEKGYTYPLSENEIKAYAKKEAQDAGEGVTPEIMEQQIRITIARYEPETTTTN